MTRRRRFSELEVLETLAPQYERHTAAELARMHGCHPETIKRSLERYGIKTRGPGETPPKTRRKVLPVVFDANARDWTPYHLAYGLRKTVCGLDLPVGFRIAHRMRRLCANCERIDNG